MEDKDANQEALEQVERITESEPVSGEDLSDTGQNETNRALQFIVSAQPTAPQSKIHNSPSWGEDKRGVDLISDVLPFGRLWYGDTNAIANAIGYAEHFSRSHDAVIRVCDESGDVIETHEHTGDFREP